MTSPHGPLLNFALVEQWILTHAERWFHHYLMRAEEASGVERNTHQMLKSYITANEWDGWPEERIPALLVQDTGLGGAPYREGTGRYRARRLYGAGIIVQAPTRRDARFAAGLYQSAFRTFVLEQPTFNHPEHVAGVEWADERPAPIPAADERNIMGQIMLFYVDLYDVADEGGVPRGPDFPNEPDDPPPNPDDPIEDLPVIQPGQANFTMSIREVEK